MVLAAAGRRQRILHLLGSGLARADAADPVMHVEGPVPALAELTCADDVDGVFDLLANDLLDRGSQASLISGLVVGLAGLVELKELDELGRPHVAAHMSGKDTFRAAGHAQNL